VDLNLHLPSSRKRKFDLYVESRVIADGNALATANELSCFNFVCAWLALLSDSPITTSFRPRKTYVRFYKTLCKNLRETVLTFADLAHKLASCQYFMGTSSTSGEWISEFEDTPVFFEYNRYFQNGDPALFEYLYTFLNFGKKLDYVDESFNSTAFRGWLDVERRLSDLTLPANHVENLHMIAEVVLPSLGEYDPWPKHGPGSVAERGVVRLDQKHNSIAYDPAIDRAFFTGHIANYGLSEDRGFSPERITPDPAVWENKKLVKFPPSRLHFVPKNLKVARSICMEPTTRMYFQQAVSDMMRMAISDCQLGKYIHLTDQTENQRLCEVGSYTGSIDTLDLSAASDSLSLDLVRRVFPPSWKIFMLATRSKDVNTPDGVKTVKKFAPMGSAVCFPTQCIIFALIGIYATCLHDTNTPVTDDTFVLSKSKLRDVLWRISRYPRGYSKSRGMYQPLGIYGDDICCDSRVTDTVTALLSLLGFEVNRMKSFTGSQSFRESCGSFYLCGYDVTPLYYRVKGVRSALTVEHIYSQVHIINDSYKRGFLNLRRVLIRLLTEWPLPKKLGRFAVPFVHYDGRDIFGIRTFDVDNSHLRSRYNRNLQRREWKCWSIVRTPSIPHGEDHERYGYIRWWASRRDQGISQENLRSGHDIPGKPRFGWRWTPAD